MKRRAFALCASLLLVGLVPGSTLAIPTSNLDQSAATGGTSAAGSLMAQTFTAGRGGLLTGVDLSLAINGTTTVSISLENVHNVAGNMVPDGIVRASGSRSVTGVSSSTPSWVHFSFTSEPTVASGTMYAIVFDPGAAAAFGGADVYAGGQAWVRSGASWIGFGGQLSDFGFRTYVDDVGTQLQWDKPQITAGTNTPLTLTATMTYANGVEASHYTALLKVMPTWFTPTGITCSDTASKIVPADCTVANFWNGFVNLILASPSGDILTFIVTGTAAPASSDIGTPGMAGADACIDYPDELTFCSDATASVDVIAAAATPTPTAAATPTPTPAATPTPTPAATPTPTAAATPTPTPAATPTPTPAATPTPTPAATPTPTAAATPTPTPAATPTPTAAATPTPFASLRGATAATPPTTSTGVGPGSDGSGSTIWLLAVALLALFGGLLVLDIRRRRLIS